MKYEINEASPRHNETIHYINVISKALGIEMPKLTGKARQRHFVDARTICYVLLKQKLDLPAIVIGSYFNKDHANVLYHLDSHDVLYRTYSDYKHKFDMAEKQVNIDEYMEDNMHSCINNMIMRIELLERKMKTL